MVEVATPRKHWILAIAITAAVGLLWAVPLWLPRIVLQYHIVRCGHLPVIASKFAAAYTYYRPGDPHYSPNVLSVYFCNEQEAEAAGYRHTFFP